VFAARNENATAVYLFGSIARGEGRPNSDVDVAVLAWRGSSSPWPAILRNASAGGSIWSCSTVSPQILSIACYAMDCSWLRTIVPRASGSK